jgi:hypothetical protein
MSSFLPEGGCYELLTIIGTVQGPSLHSCAKGLLQVSQLVSRIHGEETGFLGLLFAFFSANYGKK